MFSLEEYSLRALLFFPFSSVHWVNDDVLIFGVHFCVSFPLCNGMEHRELVCGPLPGLKWWCSVLRHVCSHFVFRLGHWSGLVLCLGIICCLKCAPRLFCCISLAPYQFCCLCLQMGFHASSDEPWLPKCVMSACHQSAVWCLLSLDNGKHLEGFSMVSVHFTIYQPANPGLCSPHPEPSSGLVHFTITSQSFLYHFSCFNPPPPPLPPPNLFLLVK